MLIDSKTIKEWVASKQKALSTLPLSLEKLASERTLHELDKFIFDLEMQNTDKFIQESVLQEIEPINMTEGDELIQEIEEALLSLEKL